MRITPIHNHLKFTSHPNPPQSPWRDNEFGSNSILDNGSAKANTLIGIMLGTILGILGTAFSETSHSRGFASDVIDTFEHVDSDSILIKDVTGDDKPDIVLLKNDSSEAVIDIYKKEIIK